MQWWFRFKPANLEPQALRSQLQGSRPPISGLLFQLSPIRPCQLDPSHLQVQPPPLPTENINTCRSASCCCKEDPDVDSGIGVA